MKDVKDLSMSELKSLESTFSKFKAAHTDQMLKEVKKEIKRREKVGK
jgi:hypothetical protein